MWNLGRVSVAEVSVVKALEAAIQLAKEKTLNFTEKSILIYPKEAFLNLREENRFLVADQVFDRTVMYTFNQVGVIQVRSIKKFSGSYHIGIPVMYTSYEIQGIPTVAKDVTLIVS
jgi:hypothetical protein